MTMDLLGMLDSIWKVLAVGLLLGAGLPALFGLGLRLLGTVPAEGSSGAPVVASGFSRAFGYVCFGLCAAIALFGIVVIVFGNQLFGGH